MYCTKTLAAVHSTESCRRAISRKGRVHGLSRENERLQSQCAETFHLFKSQTLPLTPPAVFRRAPQRSDANDMDKQNGSSGVALDRGNTMPAGRDATRTATASEHWRRVSRAHSKTSAARPADLKAVAFKIRHKRMYRTH